MQRRVSIRNGKSPQIIVKRLVLLRVLFKYRRRQEWPTVVKKNENWDAIYTNQKMKLPVLPTVDEAIVWANELIARIDAAK